MNPVIPMSASNPSLSAASAFAEPPPSYLVGQDGEGHWVAVEARGLAGGIFRTRQDAIRYACVEAGCRPEQVAVATSPVRFRLS